MADLILGYVVVEVDSSESSHLHGLVPEFYIAEYQALEAAELFDNIAKQTGQNEHINYLAARVVQIEEGGT